MVNNKINNKKGFTLIELIVVVVILGIMFGVGPQIFLQVNKFYMLNKTRIELQRDARVILSLITQNLHQANSTSIRIDQLSAQPYYSRMSFTKIDGKVIIYYQRDTNLFQVVDASTKTLTNSIRYLAFALPKSYDLTIVSVSMTLEKSIYEGGTKSIHMASEKVMVMN